MTIAHIDWFKLQPYKHDKRKSFETLCFHVASELYGAKGDFTPIPDTKWRTERRMTLSC
jgi:hypothetical protein